MTGRTNRRLDRLKQEIAAEVAVQVVGEMRKLAKLLRESGPEAVAKPVACVKLGIGMTKLKGMIRCREISVCIIGGKEMIPTEEIRRLTQPILRPLEVKRRGGGRRKTATYDPVDEFHALGKPRHKG